MRSPRTPLEGKIVTKLTVLVMAMNVEGRNKFLEFLEPFDKVRKVLFEPFFEVDAVHAPDIVAVHNVYNLRVLKKSQCQRVVGISKSVTDYSNTKSSS